MGYVQKIELNPADFQQVILKLKIRDETPVTTSTIATLPIRRNYKNRLCSFKSIDRHGPAVIIVKPGEKYSVISSKPSLLRKLSTALEEVTKTIKELNDNIEKVFDEKIAEQLVPV